MKKKIKVIDKINFVKIEIEMILKKKKLYKVMKIFNKRIKSN